MMEATEPERRACALPGRALGWLVCVASLGGGIAEAAPVASLSEDVDGDGAADALELGADGVVRISGRPRGELKLAAALADGRLSVAQYRGKRYVVVELTSQSPVAAAPTREAVILAADAGSWRELVRVPLGGIGLDHDYGVEIDATPDGIYRFQTRSDIRRCDGKPAYLFAEKFDGTKFRRTSALPSNVPGGAPALAARLDGEPAPPPLLYQARAASYEVGVADAGGLAIPRELDDGRLDTQWREELTASGGEGQFFTFEPRARDARARQLRVVPGNPASSATLRSYGRPRTLAVVSAQGAWRTELPDAADGRPGAAYVIDLPEPVAGCVTVILESTYGAPRGTTAIAELEVFADGERQGGGDALLARVIADGSAGETTAAAAIARRGAAGAAAIDAALATTTDPGARRRLIRALVGIADPAAAPALVRAASLGWVSGLDLLEVIGALGALGQVQALHDLAANGELAEAARARAIAALPATGDGFALLVDLDAALVGKRGGQALRRAVIEQLASAPLDRLLAAVAAQRSAAVTGDLWRAMTRNARAVPAHRGPALAAMLAALPAASDYERRYRLVDGIAALGDAAALRTLEAALRALPETTETAALRQVAVQAIAASPRPEAVGFVLDRARDRDPGVRLASLSALSGDKAANGAIAGATGATDAIDRVLGEALARDRWPEVRRRAATALGVRCQRPAPARALGHAVDHDPDLGVRGDAVSALVQCHAPGTAALLARLWDDARAPIELRSRAVLEAVPLGDAALAARLVGAFTRWRGEAISSTRALALAQSAAASLGRLAPPGAARALTDALDDAAFPEIVQAAALGLGALGPACPAAARARLAELARSDDQTAVPARRALAQCGK